MNPVIIGNATLHLGDCIEVMAGLPDNSLDSIICDPPYLISFMSKSFDTQHKSLPGANEGQKMQEWHRRWVTEAYRILRPGGHLAAFGGDRTHHRLMSAMEDVGFELRQCGYWIFSQGFPKSQNASKAIDQHFGMKDQREVVGQIIRGDVEDAKRSGSTYAAAIANRNNKSIFGYGVETITEPAHPLAKQYSGYGTALKPATEIIAIGRKPMIGTLSENLLAWGCGAMNLDACRVETNDSLNGGCYSGGERPNQFFNGGLYRKNQDDFKQPIGRFPPHLLHDGSDVVKKCFPDTNSGISTQQRGTGGIWSGVSNTPCGPQYGDSGSASRFFPSLPYDEEDCATLFYCAKSSKRDRDDGCGLSETWLDGIELIWDNNSTNNLLEVLLWECVGQNPKQDWNGEVIQVMGILEDTMKQQKNCDSRMSLNGNCIMGLYLTGISYITSTGKRTIIESKILNWLIDSHTKEYMEDAIKTMMDYGLNRAEIAALQNLLKKITTNGGMVFLRGVKDAAGKMQQTINAKDVMLQSSRNIHSTVKPTNLMRWICRLLTPKGGTLLDPFMGSGSTLKAAVLENFTCIGIEMDADYFAIAEARVAHVSPEVYAPSSRPERAEVAPRQQSMF